MEGSYSVEVLEDVAYEQYGRSELSTHRELLSKDINRLGTMTESKQGLMKSINITDCSETNFGLHSFSTCFAPKASTLYGRLTSNSRMRSVDAFRDEVKITS